MEVLTIALTASVCGAETCSDFADFAVDREQLFREFLQLIARPWCDGELMAAAMAVEHALGLDLRPPL